MHASRSAISDPVELDAGHLRGEPFVPMAVNEPPPPGPHSESHADGAETFNYYERHVEQVTAVRGPNGEAIYAVRYILAATDDHFVAAYFLTDFLDLLYELMVGRDFGDEVTDLVARRWPATFQLFVRGSGRVAWPALVRVRSATTRQWAVGAGYPVDPRTDLLPPDKVAKALLDATDHAVRELAESKGLLAELVRTVNWTDTHLNRQLKRAEEMIDLVTNAAGMFR